MRGDYDVSDGERHDHEHRDEEDHGPGCDGPWNCTCGALCPTHGVPLFWQTGLVAPGWVCGQCLESIPEEELS